MQPGVSGPAVQPGVSVPMRDVHNISHHGAGTVPKEIMAVAPNVKMRERARVRRER